MKYNIETHCHTLHSFDCNSKVEDIIKNALNRDINALLICDHDTYGLTYEEENLFLSNGIQLIKGIEFTTNTNAHIIGLGETIKKLERDRFFYDAKELVKLLMSEGLTIIIPHPLHLTGIIGNGNISEEDIDFILNKADFIEGDNYRYGSSPVKTLEQKYKHLKFLVGSDAHSSKDVGSFYNQIDSNSEDVVESLRDNVIKHVRLKKRSKWYWIKKRLKRGWAYQRLLHLFPAELRRKLKNLLINH